MDELQDAIEDAQYMSAMHDETLKPTHRWTYPSDEQVAAFIARLEAHNADALRFDSISAQCLGLYQLFQFCIKGGEPKPEPTGAPDPHVKVIVPGPELDAGGNGPDSAGTDHPADQQDDHEESTLEPIFPVAGMVMGFIADVIRYKRARSMVARRLLFIEIYRCYFRGRDTFEPPAVVEGELWRSMPTLTVEQAAEKYQEIFDEEAARDENPRKLPLHGDMVTRVEAAYQSVKHVDEGTLAASRTTQQEVHNTLRGDLFDEADAVCALYVKRHVYDAFRASGYFRRLMQFLYVQQRPVSENDFALFRVLGRGGFGLVHGCKKCTSGKLYAMKVMNKKRIKTRGSEKLCMNERRVLAEVDSPFIVCLKYAFVTNDDLFLILDLMTGGDLSFHLSMKGTFHKREATFYAMRVALALRHMHSLNIVYRDLKPENILMDDKGYVRVSDLGLACKITPRLSGVCGTRGYWAPEMIKRDANTGRRGTYDAKVDWWSFGCLVYEFILGKCPFRTRAAKEFGGGSDRDKNIDAATLGMEPDFYGHDDQAFQSFCRQLLNRDPALRLGANGAQEVLSHGWFRDLDQHAVEANQVTPPTRPPKDINAASQSEIGAFQDDGSAKRMELEEKDHAVYTDWGWTSPRAFQVEVIEYLAFEERMGGEANVVRLQHGDGCCTLS